MLREEDLQIDCGRTSKGDFIRLVHVPTGISRYNSGPLRGLNQHTLLQTWHREIEAELQLTGLSQYIVPEYRTKNTRRKNRGG
jgi:hypothetical protein